jgi:hypothetical protein
MNSNVGKRLSLDYHMTINEGNALRMPLDVDDDSEASSSVVGDFEDAPLAPRYAQTPFAKNSSATSVRSASYVSARASNDQQLEKTMTSIKSMALMFESGALQPSTTLRPSSFASIESATNSESRTVVVPQPPPPRKSSAHLPHTQHSPEKHDSTRSALRQFDSPERDSASDATRNHIVELEHRVEQLEELLADMHHRLTIILASQESTKIPSIHDLRQPTQAPHTKGQHNVSNNSNSHLPVAAISTGVPESDHDLKTDRSAPSSQRSGRRLSMQGVAKSIIFANRLHLPPVGQLPVFDSAACSKGIVLSRNNTAATLIQFSNTPHPLCLGPIISRGTSMLSITIYFGEPDLPTINETSTSAGLQAVLRTGSTDEIAHAIISSKPDDLCQALASSDSPTLSDLSKKFEVTKRLTDKTFKGRCEALRQRCQEIARVAASAGLCFFGVCGASFPSHGIRGDEMVWCSSFNERKEPGPPKTKPLLDKASRKDALELHKKLLLHDMKTICDSIPELNTLINGLISHRRAGLESSSSVQPSSTVVWNDMGPKQVSILYNHSFWNTF